jgi:hypothetical protein
VRPPRLLPTSFRFAPIALFLLSATVPGTLRGQGGLRERKLTNRDAEFAESFDEVGGLRELAGGKVLVIDRGARSVVLIDFSRGSQTPVGRNGQGPGEYQFPGDLVPLPGDSTLVSDRISRRFLVVGPDGTLGKTIPFPDGLSGPAEARGADPQGRIFFQGSPFSGPDADMTAIPDSVPLLRWDRARNTLDTVTRVKIPGLKVSTSGGANSRMVMIRPQPYTLQDEWAVGSTGSLALARVGDFHVEWWNGSQRVAGQPVSYTPVRVTDDDKNAFIKALQNSKGRIVVNQGGVGPREMKGPPPAVASDFQWPQTKPPFVERGSFVTPEGEFWIRRTTEARDSTPTYDVFDQRGAAIGRVLLQPSHRVVGMGKGVVYVARTDDDGLQWLERYRR